RQSVGSPDDADRVVVLIRNEEWRITIDAEVRGVAVVIDRNSVRSAGTVDHQDPGDNAGTAGRDNPGFELQDCSQFQEAGPTVTAAPPRTLFATESHELAPHT